MIDFPRNLASEGSRPPIIRIIGIGNAGVNLVDRVTIGGRIPAEIVAMNSDMQSLASSVAMKKTPLGQRATRGLGAGGDPELGWEAARESEEEIRAAVAGADIVFLCVGLGGGTASGATPEVADAVKETGALLVVIATSPFTFEGRPSRPTGSGRTRLPCEASRRPYSFRKRSNGRTQRAEIWNRKHVCSFRCHLSFLHHVDHPYLNSRWPHACGSGRPLAVLQGSDLPCLFGHGEAQGDNRAHDALARALKHPFLDRGRVLEEAGALLVHISGPSSLSFAEVGAIMQEIGRHTAEQAKIFFGVSAGGDASVPTRVTLIGKVATSPEECPWRHPSSLVVSAPPHLRLLEYLRQTYPTRRR